MDLSSRLRAIVKGGPPKPAVPVPERGGLRELTYEPDTGGYEGTMDLSRVAAMLGGRVAETTFGPCLVIDRRYEAERFHGTIRIGDCDLEDCSPLGILDPALHPWLSSSLDQRRDGEADDPDQSCGGAARTLNRTVFIDLETTGLSGGAGTLAFLVGCGYFDLGAFQVRQFLLTSHAAERALLTAVAEFFDGADLIVTYNGKTFDVPVMETRWMFHRLRMPLSEVAHFDMLHPARRLVAVARGCGRRSRRGGLPALDARAHAVRGRAGRRCPRVRDSGPLFQFHPQRRSAATRAGARAQPARPGVARSGDGARGAACAGRPCVVPRRRRGTGTGARLRAGGRHGPRRRVLHRGD